MAGQEGLLSPCQEVWDSVLHLWYPALPMGTHFLDGNRLRVIVPTRTCLLVLGFWDDYIGGPLCM